MARELVGCVQVEVGGEEVSGRIVEVEAYLGEDDPASHAGRGRTPRSEIMFGPPGFAYVYLIYGMHHCLNFVTEAEGTAGAVLVRAVEPLAGRELMAERRGLDPVKPGPGPLCGAGKLCQALGHRLAMERVAAGCRVAPTFRRGRPDPDFPGGGPPGGPLATPRIGIRQATERPFPFHRSAKRVPERMIRKPGIWF